MRKHKQPRVIVRPWVPRQIPYQVSKSGLENILKIAYPKLGKILYVGWVKRREDGIRNLYFIAATGDTPGEARERFKNSTAYNEEIWLIR